MPDGFGEVFLAIRRDSKFASGRCGGILILFLVSLALDSFHQGVYFSVWRIFVGVFIKHCSNHLS